MTEKYAFCTPWPAIPRISPLPSTSADSPGVDRTGERYPISMAKNPHGEMHVELGRAVEPVRRSKG